MLSMSKPTDAQGQEVVYNHHDIESEESVNPTITTLVNDEAAAAAEQAADASPSPSSSKTSSGRFFSKKNMGWGVAIGGAVASAGIIGVATHSTQMQKQKNDAATVSASDQGGSKSGKSKSTKTKKEDEPFPCALPLPGVLPFPPMPPLFWEFGFGITDCTDLLPPECCAPAPPTCFQTGYQITVWQLSDVFLTLEESIDEDQQMKDYVVCPGTTIAPLAFIESNVDPILAGEGDSLVNVLIKGLNLTCPTRDCTFVGGTYHILATDFIFGTPDVSGLNIEGFTFTGVMEPVEGDGGLGYGRDGLYATSIVIDGPVGNDITIKDCTFKDITFPVVDGENCFQQGYTGIYVDSPDSRIIDVSIDNVNFENIRGGLPIYALDQDQACFEDTNELRPVNRLIDNRGQLVSVTNSVIKNNKALYFYLLGVPSDAADGLTYGNIENNVFKKNTVKNLIVKELDDSLINGSVNMARNKIKGDQKYTGGVYCPVYTYDSSTPFPTDGIDNTCEATEICFDQSRAYSLNQENCAEFSDGEVV